MRIFTCGQVAKICQVSPRTVAKWCSDGGLGHYRIPTSQDRRIPDCDLIKFLAEKGMERLLTSDGKAILPELLALVPTPNKRGGARA